MTRNSPIVSGQIDLSRVRGLLFDVDGTLSDTDDHVVGRITRFLKPIAWLWKNNDPHRFARWLVMAAETPASFLYSTAGRLGFETTLSLAYSQFSRRRHAKTPEHERFWMVPDVKQMLDTLMGHYPMAVVSSREEGTTLRFLQYFDLLSYFEVIVTAQTCGRTKPFPEPVQCAAQHMGIPADECVMIGDTILDVQAGKLAGAQTIAVLCGFGSERELRRAGADLIVSSTADILTLFELESTQ
jgi:N-acetyl-D-muramate 6-phosphate phosphatase